MPMPQIAWPVESSSWRWSVSEAVWALPYSAKFADRAGTTKFVAVELACRLTGKTGRAVGAP